MDAGRPRLALPKPSSAIQLLIAINVGGMVLSALLGPRLLGEPLTSFLGLSWDGLFEGYGLGLLRLLTYQFAHAGLLHIAINMLVLFWFSTIAIEDTGNRGLVHLYLVCGAVGGICQLLLSAAAGSLDGMLVVGASGSVYGILVYAACMAPRQEVLFFFVLRVELRWLAFFLVLIGVWASLNTLHGETLSAAADAAHVGGAICGFVAFRRFRGYYLGLKFRNAPLLGWWSRWRAERARRDRGMLQAEMDRLLEKISREGMPSLTAQERRTLERASRELKRR